MLSLNLSLPNPIDNFEQQIKQSFYRYQQAYYKISHFCFYRKKFSCHQFVLKAMSLSFDNLECILSGKSAKSKLLNIFKEIINKITELFAGYSQSRRQRRAKIVTRVV